MPPMTPRRGRTGLQGSGEVLGYPEAIDIEDPSMSCDGTTGVRRATGHARGCRQAGLDTCSAEHDTGLVSRRTSSRPGAPIPVGAAEIAARLGVRPQTVHAWRHRQLMPRPRWTVSGQPAWEWPEIEAWARRTGRFRAEDAHAALLALEGTGWAGNLEALRRHRVRRR